MQKIIFITGTDTGVGKTVLTALLLSHLRQTGSRSLAVKPFCSGGRADAELLHSLQADDMALDEINPFHFSQSLAPLVAARRQRRQIHFKDVLAHIRAGLLRLSKIENRKSKIGNSTLLIEGAGGLLAPLGEGFNFLDLIFALAPGVRPKSGIQHPASSIQAIVVAPNRLGAINHTLLTAHRLRAAKIRRFKVVLMDTIHPDASFNSNADVLTELLAPNSVESIPFLGRQASRITSIRRNSLRLADILTRLSQPAHR